MKLIILICTCDECEEKEKPAMIEWEDGRYNIYIHYKAVLSGHHSLEYAKRFASGWQYAVEEGYS